MSMPKFTHLILFATLMLTLIYGINSLKEYYLHKKASHKTLNIFLNTFDPSLKKAEILNLFVTPEDEVRDNHVLRVSFITNYQYKVPDYRNYTCSSYFQTDKKDLNKHLRLNNVNYSHLGEPTSSFYKKCLFESVQLTIKVFYFNKSSYISLELIGDQLIVPQPDSSNQ